MQPRAVEIRPRVRNHVDAPDVKLRALCVKFHCTEFDHMLAKFDLYPPTAAHRVTWLGGGVPGTGECRGQTPKSLGYVRFVSASRAPDSMRVLSWVEACPRNTGYLGGSSGEKISPAFRLLGCLCVVRVLSSPEGRAARFDTDRGPVKRRRIRCNRDRLNRKPRG